MPENRHDSKKELKYRDLCEPIQDGDIVLRSAVPDLGPNIEIEFVESRDKVEV